MLLLLMAACAVDPERFNQDGDGFYGCVAVGIEGTILATEGCVNEDVDCDDLDPDVFPGAPTSCDGHKDHDCDGTPDYLMPEADCDGDGVPRDADDDGYDEDVDDCDDENSATSPDLFERCDDGFDNDCDGVQDETTCEELS